MGWQGLDYVPQEDKWWALLNTVTNLWVPYSTWNFLPIWNTISFSRWTLLHIIT